MEQVKMSTSHVADCRWDHENLCYVCAGGCACETCVKAQQVSAYQHEPASELGSRSSRGPSEKRADRRARVLEFREKLHVIATAPLPGTQLTPAMRIKARMEARRRFVAENR